MKAFAKNLFQRLKKRGLREKIKRAGQRDAGYPGDPGMQARDRRDEESAESTDDEGARRGKDVGDGANRTEPGDGGAKDA